MFTLGQIMNIQGHKIDKNLSIAFGGKNICLTPVKCVANWAKLPQKVAKKSEGLTVKIRKSVVHFVILVHLKTHLLERRNMQDFP